MSKSISLTQGQLAIVDDADFDWLNQWKWCATWNDEINSFYATRSDGKTTVYMHRIILRCEKGSYGDHRDHHTLNNQRENLRKSTASQNGANSRKTIIGYSRFKGVTLDKRRNHWMAQIRVNRKHFWLGRFDTQEDAARAYDAAAKNTWGEFAFTNFHD